MRTILTSVVGAALLWSSPVLAQDDPGATDGPAPGAWAAEFIGITTGPFGGSALRYASPTTAWRLGVRAEGFSEAEDPYLTEHHDYQGEVGLRWHAPRKSRAQPFTGLGIVGRHQWARYNSGPGYSAVEQTDVGAYGEIGAQIFVTDEIALGSRWPVHLTYMHLVTASYEVKRLRLLGGGIDVFAVIRF